MDTKNETATKVAAYLGITVDAIRHQPEKVLDEATHGMGLSLQERAALYAYRGEKSDAGTMQTFLNGKKETSLFPWRAAEERARAQAQYILDAYAHREKWETLRSTFINSAKNGLLTPTEVIAGQYLLFNNGDSEFARFSLASLLLMVPADQRVSVHNWTVAALMPAAIKQANGFAIERLSAAGTPIFPPDPELTALNAKLFTEEGIRGGGGDKLFSSRPTFAAGSIKGGGVLPVVQSQEGAPVVDVTPIEAAYAVQNSQITHLTRMVEQLARNPQRRHQNPAPSDRRTGFYQGTGQQQFVQQQFQGQQVQPRARSATVRGRQLHGGNAEEDTILDELSDVAPPALRPPPPPPPPYSATVPAQGAPPRGKRSKPNGGDSSSLGTPLFY